MRAIDITQPGGLEVLRLTDRPRPAPGAGDVLVKVAAAGVNRPDVAQRIGVYPPPPGASDILGLDIAGTVVEVGEGVAGLKAGDAVCALVAGGGYADYCLAPAPQVLPVPQGLSLVEAAALPEVFFTAWNNLVLHGRLEQGDSVLIQGGASGVGVAAIQIAKQLFGSRVIVTASSQAKIDFCLSLGADAAVDYRREDWPQACVEANDGKMLDFILDSQAGDYLAKHISIMGFDARLVMLAAHRGALGEADCRTIVSRRLVVTGSTLRPRPVAYKHKVASALQQNVWPLLASGSIKAPIQATFPLEDVREAHRILDENRQMGKVVLIVDPSQL